MEIQNIRILSLSGFWMVPPTKLEENNGQKGFVPSMHSMKDLIDKCEWIKWNKTPIHQDNDNNKKEVCKKQKQQQKKSPWAPKKQETDDFHPLNYQHFEDSSRKG